MRTRTPRDPLAEDHVEQFLNRYGLARILATGTGLIVAFVIAAVLALSALGAGVVALEAVDPTLPGRALHFVDPGTSPSGTDRVARVAESVPTTEPAHAVTAPSALASVPAATRAAAPSARAAAGHTPATPPGRPWAALLTPSVPAPGTPPAASQPPAVAQPAPAARPTVPPVTEPTTEPVTEPTTEPSTARTTPPTTTTATSPPASSTTTAPAPAPSTSDDSWDPSKGHGRGNGGCPPGQHKKGKC
jgi:hypothetical protein